MTSIRENRMSKLVEGIVEELWQACFLDTLGHLGEKETKQLKKKASELIDEKLSGVRKIFFNDGFSREEYKNARASLKVD